ncbi:hypothetical protein [Ligilactobacillus sp. LYQ60]|uniref:hypothetical protein n=1 Tax=Ligilactobacillus sp. LYQ60 TaxID=3378799 RepID=UPI003854E24B
MIALKLAFRGMHANRRIYGPNLIAMALLVAVNYIILAVTANQSIHHLLFGKQLVVLLHLTFELSIIITIAFLVYVSSMTARSEAHEFRVYTLLGMAPLNKRLIIVIRQACVTVGGLGLGLLLGINFERFVFMTLARILGISHFHAPLLVGPLETCGEIFIIISGGLILFRLFYHSAGKSKGQPTNRLPWLGGIAGILTTVTGYYLSMTSKPGLDAIPTFMLIIVLVTAGMYGCFIAGSILVLNLLQHNRQLYYHRRRFIIISGLRQRMRQNGASLAGICVMVTSVLLSMIAVVSLMVGERSLIRLWNPEDVITATVKPFSPAQRQIINQTAHRHHLAVTDYQQSVMTAPIMGNLTKSGQFTPTKPRYQLAFVPVDEYNRVTRTHYHLQDNQALVYCPDNQLQLTTLTINQRHFTVVHQLKKYPLFYDYQHAIYQPVFVILSNRKQCVQTSRTPWLFTTFFNTVGKKHAKIRFADDLQARLHLTNEEYTAKYQQGPFLATLFGGAFFIGIIISVVFIIVTVMLIYYKQLAEGLQDRARFQTLFQLGLSAGEARQIVCTQVLTVFLLPLAGALLNTCFAFPAIRSMLKLFSIYNGRMVLLVSLTTAGLIGIGYALIYLLTARNYYAIIHDYRTNNDVSNW